MHFTWLEQEMEKKSQEHLQELEGLHQKSSLDKESLEHNAKLKRQQAEVRVYFPTEAECVASLGNFQCKLFSEG